MTTGFELLEHGGDLRLRGWGTSAGEAAGALLGALWAAMFGGKTPPEPQRWEAWGAPDGLPLAMALVELLSDALYRASVSGQAAVAFEGTLESGRVGLVALTEGRTPVREVKAVTYNDPLVERCVDGRWIAEVTVDL